MRDQRLRVFRNAVDALIESLHAIVRIARWEDAEAPPAPLVAAAAKVQERLGAADRLASTRYSGTAADVAIVTELCDVMKRLDASFLTYCKNREASGAANTLEAEVSAVSDSFRETLQR